MERWRAIGLEVTLAWLLLAGACGVGITNRWLEAHGVSRLAGGDLRVLPDGRALRVASLGFERLCADLFWIRTVTYVGDEAASAAHWPAAEALANLVTDIDPHFDTVYVVMASVLNGLGSDPDAAIRILEKGASVSSYWRIHFLLGFQYFMEKQDYERGAAALQRATELGGPPYLQFLVSRLYTSAGDPTTAMQFIVARLRNEENPDVRAKLEKRLSDIQINRDLGWIDTAIASFRESHHRAPKSVRELVDARLLPAMPRDPKGGEYSIADGHATTEVPYEVLSVKPVKRIEK